MDRPDVMEHEARGLLNLITLLSRCLRDAGGNAEHARWQAEVDEAKARLERLYEAGLSRTFLTDKPAKAAVVPQVW